MQVITSLQNRWDRKKNRWQIVLVGIIVFILLAWIVGNFIPEQIDLSRTYRPATREIISLRSPYNVSTFYNPPWILIPLIPIALLPNSIGNGVLFLVSLIVLIYTAIRMGASRVSLLAFIFSFPVYFLLLFGQIDWLVLFGFVLPPQFGLVLIMSKPQIGLPYAIFLMIESWRVGGIRSLIRAFLPATFLFIFSFLIFGFWIKPLEPHNFTAIYNLSLWPTGVVIGLVLLVKAIRKRDKVLSIAAGPFFSPYVAVHSWATSFLAILPQKWESVAVAVGSWIVCLILIMN